MPLFDFGPPMPMFPSPAVEGGKFSGIWQRWLTKLYSLLSEPTYDDINVPLLSGKVPAVNAPTLTAFVGNLKEYSFAVNDYLDLPSIELMHDWEEGTEIEVHVHWATGGTNNATPRGVKWQVEYSLANKQGDGGTEYFSGSTLLSAESTIEANEAAAHHRTTSLGTITTTGYKIGAAMLLQVKRIAAAGTAPAANPFGLQVGVHYKRGILGSRSRTTK